MTYQENLLSLQNALDGHDVLIIASRYSWEKDRIVKLPECSKMLVGGIKLVRISYDNILNDYISEKVRKASALMPIVREFDPDIIFFHDIQAFEIINVARYRKNHPNVRLVVDVHSDFNNSALNALSYVILHKILYKSIILLSIRHIDRIYCVTDSCIRFVREAYGIKGKKVELFPLGGVVSEGCEKEIEHRRELLGIDSNDIVLLHSGKFNRKKRTKELLMIFNSKVYAHMKLLLIGTINNDDKESLELLVNSNPNILFLGWKSGNQLLEYLRIADIYVQPGSASATLQNAICAGNAIIAYDSEIYANYVKGNGWLISNIKEIGHILDEIENNPALLSQMKEASLRIGRNELDYHVLARRVYSLIEE
jgi:glycosyltransferase involved in cell wall biosynthesis